MLSSTCYQIHNMLLMIYYSWKYFVINCVCVPTYLGDKQCTDNVSKVLDAILSKYCLYRHYSFSSFYSLIIKIF